MRNARSTSNVVDILSSTLHVDQPTAGKIIESTPALQTDCIASTLTHNIHCLQQLWDNCSVVSIIADQPSILAQPLERWFAFLTAYGLGEDAVARLLKEEPELFLGCIYQTGRAILLFKEHGYTNQGIRERIVQYYPSLLKLHVDRDMQPVLQYLAQQGCQGSDLRQLLWEYPRIFGENYRRRVRTFQHLGVYGLNLPGRKSS